MKAAQRPLRSRRARRTLAEELRQPLLDELVELTALVKAVRAATRAEARATGGQRP